MNAIITVFKGELDGKEAILEELRICCSAIEEIANAFVISPHPGKLIESIEILRKNSIAYGTHFNTARDER